VINGVDAVAVLADETPQRRAEDRIDDVGEPVGPPHGDAESRPDRTVRAVSGDEVAGVDGPDLAGRDVAQADLDAVGPVLHAHHLGIEVNARGAQRAQVLQQHRLEVVLGHAGRGRRAEDRGLLARRHADGPHRTRGHGRQRLRLPSAPLDVDATGSDGVLHSPGAHELHRAQAHRGRARQRGQIGPALDEQCLHPEPRQRDRGRQSGRAGSHDDDRRFVVPHGLAHFVGHHVFDETSCQLNML
jgi:hypothetical protein